MSSKILVLVDLDHTLCNIRKLTNFRYFDPDVLETNRCVRDLLYVYQKMGARIVILTGRSDKQRDQITTYIQKRYGPNVEVCTKPPTARSVLSYKVETMTRLVLEEDPEMVIHLEDDMEVLRQCCGVVQTMGGIRYFGILVKERPMKDGVFREGLFAEIVTSPTAMLRNTTILTLVQPGSPAKTAILESVKKMYEEKGFTVMFFSLAKIEEEIRETHKDITQETFNAFRRQLVQKYIAQFCNHDLVVMDMGCDGVDILRHIQSEFDHVVAATFMPRTSASTETGTAEFDADPAYALQIQDETLGVIDLAQGQHLTTKEAVDRLEPILDEQVEHAMHFARPVPAPYFCEFGVPVMDLSCKAPENWAMIQQMHFTVAQPTNQPGANLQMLGARAVFHISPELVKTDTSGHACLCEYIDHKGYLQKVKAHIVSGVAPGADPKNFLEELTASGYRGVFTKHDTTPIVIL